MWFFIVALNESRDAREILRREITITEAVYLLLEFCNFNAACMLDRSKHLFSEDKVMD